MLTVRLKILLENTLNQCEYKRWDRGHGKSQVAEDTEYFRPGEDLDRVSRRGTENDTWTRRVPLESSSEQ